MKLTKDNLEILKSLAQINEQVFITPNTLGISTNDRTLIAYYNYGINFTVPQDNDGNEQEGVGIYNLNELLSILSLYENPSITEGSDRLTILEDKNTNEYRYTPKNCITVPIPKEALFEGDEENDIERKVLDPVVEIDITEDEFDKLLKQSQILKAPHIKFDGNTISITDVDDSSSNTYTTEVAATNTEDPQKDPVIDCFISVEKFQKLVKSAYTVKLDGNTVVFENKTKNLTYVVCCLVE